MGKKLHYELMKHTESKRTHLVDVACECEFNCFSLYFCSCEFSDLKQEIL